MFKKVVEESKLSRLLRPRLLSANKLTCQMSQDGKVVINVKRLLVGSGLGEYTHMQYCCNQSSNRPL